MADSFNKKEREKRRQKKKKDKAERKKQRKLDGVKGEEFMYVDENGQLTAEPPDPTKKIEINVEDIEISIPKKEKAEPMETVRNGTVKFFNTEKGYGFIIDDDTNLSYFVHIENITGEIRDRDKVQFEIGSGPKGPVALLVKLA